MNEEKERFIEIFTRCVTREGANELLSWLDSADFL